MSVPRQRKRPLITSPRLSSSSTRGGSPKAKERSASSTSSTWCWRQLIIVAFLLIFIFASTFILLRQKVELPLVEKALDVPDALAEAMLQEGLKEDLKVELSEEKEAISEPLNQPEPISLVDYQHKTIQQLYRLQDELNFSKFMKQIVLRVEPLRDFPEISEEQASSSEFVPLDYIDKLDSTLRKRRCSLFVAPTQQKGVKRKRQDSNDNVELFPGVKISVFDNHDMALHKWIKWRDVLFSPSSNEPSSESEDSDCNRDNTILIHIDSHPDMALPKEFDATKFTLDKKSRMDESWLLENVQIANFITPALYTQMIHKVVWVAPPFAKQIPRGEHNITLGVYPGSAGQRSKMGVSSTLEYYAGHMKPKGNKKLMHTITVPLQVITLGEFFDVYRTQGEKTQAYSSLTSSRFAKQCPSSRTRILLDIDLDYFSTIHPALTFFHQHNTTEVRSLVSRIVDPLSYCSQDEERFPLQSMPQTVKDVWRDVLFFGLHYQQIADISMRHFLNIVRPLTHTYWCAGQEDAQDFMVELYELLDSMEANSPGRFNHMLIGALPLYIASKSEVVGMAQELAQFLLEFSQYLEATQGTTERANVDLVTIARSVQDDYTPAAYWEGLEVMVYNILKAVYTDQNTNIDGAVLSFTSKPWEN